jgi:hypothetical protein
MMFILRYKFVLFEKFVFDFYFIVVFIFLYQNSQANTALPPAGRGARLCG